MRFGAPPQPVRTAGTARGAFCGEALVARVAQCQGSAANRSRPEGGLKHGWQRGPGRSTYTDCRAEQMVAIGFFYASRYTSYEAVICACISVT